MPVTQLPIADLDGGLPEANEYNSTNTVGEDTDADGLLGWGIDDYELASDTDDEQPFVFDMKLGNRTRSVTISVSLNGLDKTRVFNIINMLNTISGGAVIRVYKLYAFHTNSQAFDTLPESQANSKQGTLSFQVYDKKAQYANSHYINIPWIKQNMSDSEIITVVQESLVNLGFHIKASLSDQKVKVSTVVKKTAQK